MEKYYKLTDSENFGKIVKAQKVEGKAPRAFIYDKGKADWQPMVGFFFTYMIPEEDNKYEMFDELSEAEAKKYMKDFVKKAHEIATNAHKGQKDKAGLDYIKHPEFVANLVNAEEEKATAYLHDTLEDTALTIDDLRESGIPEAVINAVSVLTKNKAEEYFDYLKKVKENPIARKVKLADLKHNSDLTRLEHITSEDMKRVVKYKKAKEFLEQ